MVSAAAAAAAAAAASPPSPMVIAPLQDPVAPGAPTQLSRAVPVQRTMLDPVINLGALFDDEADGPINMDVDGDSDAD